MPILKSKLQMFIIVIILILVLVLAYFGYEISNQNNQQTGQVVRQEVEKIREEAVQEFNDFNNENNLSQNNNSNSNQTFSEQPTTGYQENLSPSLDLEQENIRENSNQNTSTETNLKKINSLENLSPEMRVVYDRTLGKGLLKQENTAIFDPSLYFTEKSGENKFLGRGVILNQEFQQNQKQYYFILTQDLFGVVNFYFATEDFNQVEKIEPPFQKIVRDVRVKENSTEVIFKLADGNGRNVTITERKIDIVELFNQSKIEF